MTQFQLVLLFLLPGCPCDGCPQGPVSASQFGVGTSTLARAFTGGLGLRDLWSPLERGWQQQICRDLGSGGSWCLVSVGGMVLGLPYHFPVYSEPSQREHATSCSVGRTCSFKATLLCSGSFLRCAATATVFQVANSSMPCRVYGGIDFLDLHRLLIC